MPTAINTAQVVLAPPEPSYVAARQLARILHRLIHDNNRLSVSADVSSAPRAAPRPAAQWARPTCVFPGVVRRRTCPAIKGGQRLSTRINAD